MNKKYAIVEELDEGCASWIYDFDLIKRKGYLGVRCYDDLKKAIKYAKTLNTKAINNNVDIKYHVKEISPKYINLCKVAYKNNKPLSEIVASAESGVFDCKEVYNSDSENTVYLLDIS